MVKIALVVSTFILSMFSFIISDAYDFTAKITDNPNTLVLSGQWQLFGVEVFVLAGVLAIGFVIQSRKK
jgi:cell division protein FtsW (lipid II flippase)